MFGRHGLPPQYAQTSCRILLRLQFYFTGFITSLAGW